jgi:ubiquitin-conjugating enzyme E2 M
MGIWSLFNAPNPKDPLNKEAAELMMNDLEKFKSVVKQTLKGGYY